MYLIGSLILGFIVGCVGTALFGPWSLIVTAPIGFFLGIAGAELQFRRF